MDKKEILLKIHASKHIKFGESCVYVQLNKSVGVKFFGNKKDAEESLHNQKFLNKLHISPNVLYKVMVLQVHYRLWVNPLLMAQWEESYGGNAPVEYRKVYGYLTQHAETKFNKNKVRGQIKNIEDVIEKHNMRYDDLIGVWDNLGVIKNRLVIIDTDKYTIWGNIKKRGF